VAGLDEGAKYIRGLVGFSFEYLDRFRCRHDQQYDVATLSFCLHSLHHRQSSGASTDYQVAALPRYRVT